MGKTLYLECYSGISGDMTVAALLDLGADRSVLDRVLKSLKVSGFETKISRVVKSGIDACDFDVVLDKDHENYDHDMEYLHGHHHEGHESNHAHGTGTAQDHHHHEHRGIKEITYIIEHSAMTENAKKIADSHMTELSIRVPVIPGFNDTELEIRDIAAYVRKLGNVRRMHLLPYHRLGQDKYDGLNRPYLMGDVKPPTNEKMERLLKVAEEVSGVECRIGG